MTIFHSRLVSVSFAIFSMLFGAGNLIFPLATGMESGSMNLVAISGFLFTAICLPLIGLIAMILFDGDYIAFFNRLGVKAGSITIGFCMLVIGPIIAVPRIVTLSHIMTAPFLPIVFLQEINLASSTTFALIFLFITFLCTFRKNTIIDVLGNYISPLLLFSLSVIIIKGLYSAENFVSTKSLTLGSILFRNIIRGYETLDLLGTIFFCSMIINMLKAEDQKQPKQNNKKTLLLGLKAGIAGLSCLSLVYLGMSYLGAFYGHGIIENSGALFSIISFRVLGQYGAAIISTAVFMACLSTSIALVTVLSDYTQKTIFNNNISFISALTLVLLSCLPLSTAGLSTVLSITAGPIIYISYPCLIVLCLCNIAYKAVGFTPIKIPIVATLVLSATSYFFL